MKKIHEVSGFRRLSSAVRAQAIDGQTWAMMRVQFQITAIKRISQKREPHEFFGFPVHIKVTFTLDYRLLSV